MKRQNPFGLVFLRQENSADSQGLSFEGDLGLSLGDVGSGECIENVQLGGAEKIGSGSKNILVAFANELGPFVRRAEKINVFAGQGNQLRFDEALDAVELLLGEGVVTHGLLNARGEAFGFIVTHAVGDGIEERSAFRPEQGTLAAFEFLSVAVAFAEGIGESELPLEKSGDAAGIAKIFFDADIDVLINLLGRKFYESEE